MTKNGKISVFLALERKTVLKFHGSFRAQLKNNNGKRFYGAFCVFLTKNGTYLSVLTVQVSEEINTENVPTVSHALLHKKRKTVRFSLRKIIFSSVKSR